MIRRIKIAYLWFCILTLFFLIRRSTAACRVLTGLLEKLYYSFYYYLGISITGLETKKS